MAFTRPGTLLLLLLLAVSLVTPTDGSNGSGETYGTCDSSNGGGDGQQECQHRTPSDAVSAALAAARRRALSSSAATPPSAQTTCQLFLAQSTIPNSGLGVFTSAPLPRGIPIGPPDLVIQIPDLDQRNGADGLSLLLSDYLWDAQETGGQYEGRTVYSAVPGLGMAANGHLHLYNVLPYRPDVDEADVPRTTSPGAGAFSHYHNYSYYTQRPIEAGGEIFVNYGSKWFREREGQKKIPPIAGFDENDAKDTTPELHIRTKPWLVQNGLCLDNIRPGRSTNKQAGRGAFATRLLEEGTVIAPVPVVPITRRDALRTARIKQKSPTSGSKEGGKKGKRGGRQSDTVEEGWQLLLNYCYGHVNSTMLLFPYGMAVNFINHADSPINVNAELRWSTSDQHRGQDWPTQMSLEQVKGLDHSGLMLEFVALRDIRPGEEIFINYGSQWRQAWRNHVDKWKPVEGAKSYTPSYVMDDVASKIRTEAEQKRYPYGDNLITSCFYRYSDNADGGVAAGQSSSNSNTNTNGGDDGSSSSVETTAVRWEMKRGLFEYSNLRPCSILRRDETSDGKGGTHYWYTVLIRNRYGLDPNERIPKGMMHVVNYVPRHAIRFSDKLYTTDQHLPNAFRHEIGLPEGVFPEAWMDLSRDDK